MTNIHAHQMRLDYQIKRLSAKQLKQHQAHLLCNSLIAILEKKV